VSRLAITPHRIGPQQHNAGTVNRALLGACLGKGFMPIATDKQPQSPDDFKGRLLDADKQGETEQRYQTDKPANRDGRFPQRKSLQRNGRQ